MAPGLPRQARSQLLDGRDHEGDGDDADDGDDDDNRDHQRMMVDPTFMIVQNLRLLPQMLSH